MAGKPKKPEGSEEKTPHEVLEEALPELDQEKSLFDQQLELYDKGVCATDLLNILMDMEDTTKAWADKITDDVGQECEFWTVATVRVAWLPYTTMLGILSSSSKNED